MYRWCQRLPFFYCQSLPDVLRRAEFSTLVLERVQATAVRIGSRALVSILEESRRSDASALCCSDCFVVAVFDIGNYVLCEVAALRALHDYSNSYDVVTPAQPSNSHHAASLHYSSSRPVDCDGSYIVERRRIP